MTCFMAARFLVGLLNGKQWKHATMFAAISSTVSRSLFSATICVALAFAECILALVFVQT
eukprot:2133859-Amphidinium_carterae.1